MYLFLFIGIFNTTSKIIRLYSVSPILHEKKKKQHELGRVMGSFDDDLSNYITKFFIPY